MNVVKMWPYFCKPGIREVSVDGLSHGNGWNSLAMICKCIAFPSHHIVSQFEPTVLHCQHIVFCCQTVVDHCQGILFHSQCVNFSFWFHYFKSNWVSFFMRDAMKDAKTFSAEHVYITQFNQSSFYWLCSMATVSLKKITNKVVLCGLHWIMSRNSVLNRRSEVDGSVLLSYLNQSIT